MRTLTRKSALRLHPKFQVRPLTPEQMAAVERGRRRTAQRNAANVMAGQMIAGLEDAFAANPELFADLPV